jgi:hypothetical protein
MHYVETKNIGKLKLEYLNKLSVTVTVTVKQQKTVTTGTFTNEAY